MKNGLVIDNIGIKYWYVNDLLHREDGPAIECIRSDGSSYYEWHINGHRHRIGGPAVQYLNGNRVWYVNGKEHREDGPAIEYENGSKSWYYDGRLLSCTTQEEFERLLKLKAFW